VVEEPGGTNQDEFVSEALWRQDNDHVLVMACSDPRFTEARHELIDARYGFRRYDPIIVPGGPQTVLQSAPYYFLIRGMVTLLNSAHGFRQIIGISHYDCRAYKELYPRLGDTERRERQLADLQAFVPEMQHLVPGAAVEAFYSEPLGDRIRFISAT